MTATASVPASAATADSASGDCLEQNAWICGEYVREYWPDIATALRQHVVLTVVSVVIGMLIAFPLALLVRRRPAMGLPVIGTTTVLYTIPSLAMFAILQPFTGLDASTVVIGLVLYSLTILVGNTLAGLRAVPADAIEAARGMGYGPTRLLLRVELPLALPTVMAGVRVATVSTVALVTVGSVVGSGGLGNLIQTGIDTQFKAQVLTASVLCVLLAVAFDLVLLLVQRMLTPWQRTPRRRRRRREFVPGPVADVGIDDTHARPKAVA
ncbi:ABC transporter permease [Yinghuangia soli]|uniref:ABC transporter permease n=1 Tax=Yinghuangia soli TaxID=2908204 RepID=A0AA41U194_9ACTN|nr:ABC transporter permease [Yinghuangia soli]MCF2529320.1 ABC transporter permease [Yinghuangia soli]